jgi:hypothetical protein
MYLQLKNHHSLTVTWHTLAVPADLMSGMPDCLILNSVVTSGSQL